MKRLASKFISCVVIFAVLSGACAVAFAADRDSVVASGDYKAGSSIYGKALTQSQLTEVADAVALFLNTYIDPGMGEPEKVAAACAYLVNTCSYADDWSKNGANTAWGALIYKEAQCSGYARAFKALCDGMGVDCHYVHADATAVNPSHQWNIVKVGGNWYHIDVQAFDDSGEWSAPLFILVSDAVYAAHGFAWDKGAFPACPSNYGALPDKINLRKPSPVAAQSPAAPPASTLTARPTASTVLVDGATVSFDAYNINDNNYFKLRDLAYVLRGTSKQFEVGWNGASNTITLTRGVRYTPVGGEMSGKGAGNKTPAPTTSKITLDGKTVSFTAYNIGGNNYFKLRDIGAAFDFGVDWDGANNAIVIDTSKSYTPEGIN